VQLFDSEQDARAFAAALPTRDFGRTIDYRPRTGSTNDNALQAARNSAPHGELFITDAQDSGRGRRGRAWESPPGLSLLFSVIVRPAEIRPEDIGWIPLAAGLACAEGIAEASSVRPQIKWPNDLVIPAPQPPGWRKIGGILCESVLPAAGNSAAAGHVIIGIGVNVNQQSADLHELAKAPPTSIAVEQGSSADRRTLLSAILLRLEARCEELSRPEWRAGVKSEVESRLRQWWPPRRMLQIELPAASGGEMLRGEFAGLDDFGRLKLRDSSGKEHALADAEIISIDSK
jgi:BirA family biotin operon repressor/biotin-[acetyl-CoA-carboxylase] ligase